MPDAVANFVFSEKEITTTPEFPGICDINTGSVVMTKETFLYYQWISLTGKHVGNSSTALLKET